MSMVACLYYVLHVFYYSSSVSLLFDFFPAVSTVYKQMTTTVQRERFWNSHDDISTSESLNCFDLSKSGS